MPPHITHIVFPFVLQTLLLLAAGAALFRLWRVAASLSPGYAWMVAGGVALRAALGVPMFWVSYLQLPFARSLQLGNGFWWFASDATGYFGRAVNASHEGLGGVLTIDPLHPSVVYTKILAGFVWLLGSVASVGLLLNLFSYLAVAAFIAMWARRFGVSARVAALPLLAVAYSPSWILWSTQPLKDAFFCFVIITFALALDQWVRAWRETERRYGRIAVIGLLLAVLIYTTAGTRWYYAVIALGCAVVPIVSAVFAATTPRQRAVAAAAALALLLLLNRQIVAGAGTYLPDSVRRVMELRFQRSYTAVAETVEESRSALDSFVDANTRIKAGEALREQEKPAAVAGTGPAAPAPATAAPAPAAARAASSEEGGGPAISDVPVTFSGRLIAGLAAMLLPHFVAEALGLISVGEARGLWWFANLDTVLFDLFVVFSLVLFLRRWRAAWRDPFAWYVLAVSAAMTGAIAYTISNFGALMRHRSMVLSTMVMLPLIAYRARERARRVTETEPAAERVPDGVPLTADR